MKRLLLSLLFIGVLFTPGVTTKAFSAPQTIVDVKSLPQKGQAVDIAKLKKIQTALFQGKRNPFVVAHFLKIQFTSVSDYRALYGLLSYLANDDFTEGDFDYIARTLDEQETHMLAQLP